MSRGRRYDDTPKLNVKKVIAVVVAVIVFIMFFISIKNLLTTRPKTKDVTSATTYFPAFTNNKWGVIDNTGKIIVNVDYDEMVVVPDKNKDLFICTYGVDYQAETYNTKVIDKDGKTILNDYTNVRAIENSDGSNVWYENDTLIYENSGKYGLINFSGKQILEAEYDNIYALDGIEKNIIIEKNGKKGLVNTSMGEIIIQPEYDSIETVTSTYENGYIVGKNGKFGIISADAKIIFEPKYDEVKKVASEEYYAVVENGKLELVDLNGNIKLDSGFDDIKEINGDNLVIVSGENYGVIGIDGTELIKPEYQNLKFAYGTYYIAEKNETYGVISSTGGTLVDFLYTSMEYIKTADFFEADNSNYKTDLIDRQFNTVLQNIIVSELNLEDGYIRVRDGDEYSYYNFKFEKQDNQKVLTTSTLFLVKEYGKYGYENKNGDRIVDCIYDDAREQNQFGYCAVKKDGVWGCLKSDGTVVVKPSVNLDENLYVDFIGEWYLDKDLSLSVYTR